MHESNQDKVTVDFIGLGTPKSGTTWIYKCLSEHPEVCMSKHKETGYFVKCVRGESPGVVWYQELFSHCKDNKLKGEFSVDYFTFDEVAKEIKQQCPNAKMIVSLRNPLERMLSHFLYSRFEHHKTMSFSEAVEKNPEYYLEPSLYAKHLKAYYEIFPKEQVLVCVYEDMVKDPETFMKRIYKFLGVDDAVVVPNTHAKTNVSAARLHHSYVFDNFLLKTRRTIMRTPLFKPFYSFLKFTHISDLGSKLFELNKISDTKRKPIDKSQVSEGERAIVSKKLLADTLELEQLIGRKLSAWHNK